MSDTLTSTLDGLRAPRRLVPVALLGVPLVVAQASFSSDPLAAPLGVLMVASFLLVGPASWRWLFPLQAKGDGAAALPSAVRIGLYLLLSGGLVLLVGAVIPRLTGMGWTFLTDHYSLAIAFALFVVGGWGLGRDIDLEAGLEQERQRVRDLAREAEQAQLLALRAHLDPHFLFNTLNAIAEWCREDGEVAERATLELSRMLRTVLRGVRARSWPLAEELALLETLFSLHRFRDPERFETRWRIEDALPDVHVPPMLLLPLGENAVKHGPGAGHRGAIEVGAERLDTGAVRFWIENPGPNGGPREGGEGLAIVERRLALAYGAGASLTLDGSDGGTRATVVLPAALPQEEA